MWVRHARLLMVVSALLWSSSGFFVKSPFFSGWPGSTLAFWRAAFACVILWPLVRRPQWSLTLVPMTAMFAAMNYTYLTAMADGSAANAIWLQCTGQVWVLLIGVFAFQERAVWRDWLFVLFAAAGVGVNVGLLFSATFALGSGLAGLGGALAIDVLGLDPAFALKYLVYFLIVVVVGGAGSLRGSLVAAVLLGVVDVAGKYYIPQSGSFIIYAAMVGLLIVFPAGLDGRRRA